MRVKGGSVSRKRHKKVLEQASGFRGSLSKLFRPANQALMKALRYSYRDRRNKKRDMRALWIVRINAAARLNGISYSQLINGLKKANVEVNRKVLSHLAITDAQAFAAVVTEAKKALAAA